MITPYEDPYGKHVYHQYAIWVMNGKRDKEKQFLADQSIGSMVYYSVRVQAAGLY